MLGKSKKLQPSRRAFRAALIDALEPRRMLATFTATSGNDTIDIFNWAGGGMAIRINGVINTTTDTSITINAGLGNDKFNASSSRSGTTILAKGEDGNDTMDNPSVLDLDSVYVANFTFDGGSGTDFVNASNDNDAAHSLVMSVTGSAISKASDALIQYNNVETVQYWDSDNSSFIAFYDAHTSLDNVALIINSNDGNDFIYNAFSNWDTAIGTGGATINDGGGIDTLQLTNTSTATNAYQFIGTFINGSSSPGSGTGSLSYSGIENLNFTGGSHNESIAVNSKISVVALNVDGGSGNDIFTIGNNDFDDSGLLLSNTTIIGGAGNDSMTIQDQADKDSPGEVENYNWFSTTFSKGPEGFNYSGFENQTLVAANGTTPGFLSTVPQVNLNSVASSMEQTVVIGGNARGCIVNLGAGNLTNINGDVFLNLAGTGFDQINFYHDLSNVNTLYQIGYSQLVAPKTINFTNAATVNIHAGAQSDTFFVDGSAPGTSVVVNGNLGNDVLHLGGGNVGANLNGPVTFNGGSGNNETIIDNTTDSTFSTQAIRGNVFIDGQSHTFNTQSRLVVNGGPGGSNMTISTAGGFLTEIHGDNGNDHFDVGGGDIDANMLPTQPLVISGGGGTDSIRFDDTNDTNLNGFINLRRQGLSDQLFIDDVNDDFVNWMGIESATFDASNAEYPGTGASASYIVVLDMATPLTINGNGGPDSIQVQDAAFPVIVNTGPGEGDSIFLNADLDAIPGAAILQQSDAVRDLGISAGGMLRVENGAVLDKTGTLAGNLTINGVLDLAGGALLSRASGTSPDFFKTRLIAGRNGGAWDGTSANGAIHSSLASSSPASDGVGYGLGSEIAPTTIGPFTIAAGDTLIRYTLDGDANLDQQVNLIDFNRLAANFGLPNRVWATGDSNYDAAVNLIDFNALAGNFGMAASPATVAQRAFNVLFAPSDDARAWLDQLT